MMSRSACARSAERCISDNNASRTATKNPLRRMTMSEPVNQDFPIVYLARHGDRACTRAAQYTVLTAPPLTERGERNARRLEERLRELSFSKVFTSPLPRARRTCELASFGARAGDGRDF